MDGHGRERREGDGVTGGKASHEISINQMLSLLVRTHGPEKNLISFEDCS